MLHSILTQGIPALDRARLNLEIEDFYDPKHRAIFAEIVTLAAMGKGFDERAVGTRIEKRNDAEGFGTRRYVESLAEAAPPAMDAKRAALAVREAADQRRAILGATKALQAAREGADHRPVMVDLLSAPSLRWARPVALGDVADLPAFPLEVLPEPLATYTAEVATALQVPPDMVGLLTLGALSTVSAGRFVIKLREDWREPLNTYTMTALPPGEKKSATFGELQAPIREAERLMQEQARPRIIEASAARALASARLDRTKGRAANRKKPPSVEEAAEDARNVAELARQVDECQVPASPRLIYDDATPEKIAVALEEQGGRLAIWSPEGSIFEIMGGRYSGGDPNLEVYLQGHSGDPLTVDRLGRPPVRVAKPALTVVITIQPSVLAGLATRPGFKGRGLLDRFLYAVPRSKLGSRDLDPPPIREAMRREYARILNSILYAPLEADPRALTLSAGAHEVFGAFRRDVEPLLVEGAELGGPMSGWGSKLPGATARIAGLLHLAEQAAQQGPLSAPVSTLTVKAAILIACWAIAHARAAYGQMGADAAVLDARRALSWIERERRPFLTAQVAFQALKTSLGTMERTRAALRVLVDHNVLRELPEPDGRRGPGRPVSTRYEVNPHLFTPCPKPPKSSETEASPDIEDSGGIEAGGRRAPEHVPEPERTTEEQPPPLEPWAMGGACPPDEAPPPDEPWIGEDRDDPPFEVYAGHQEQGDDD